MSTNATISVQMPDGSILSTYLHYDGYISEAFRKLKAYYSSQDLAEDLLEGGAMSSLGDDTESTVYYHRDMDRQWIGVQPQMHSTRKYFDVVLGRQSFNYLWTGQEWEVI